MNRFRNFRMAVLPLAAALLLCLAAGSLTGCAKLKKWTGLGGETQAPSPEDLARKGMDEFNHGGYHDAIDDFQKLKDQHPFSNYSLLAELKIADSKYYLEDYEEARTLYEDFEKNHPANEAVPYVLFQIGMCYFKRIGTIDRDPAGATESIQAFSRLLRTFPQSPYTQEATARINEARNFLAAHELYVAKFYLRTGSVEQGASRLEYLLATFPESKPAPEARELLAAVRAGHPPGR
ncbi:MAG: outer membrane protein assembly factor BamD, partial [Desulfobacteraceae bacterium]|nr:outer membrane protein assembly factor BamD [Desulfobacteraceae bacterium]